MFDRSAVTEEHFGILTDDGLALEATMVRPAGLADEDVLVIQVWVPKSPLTQSSVLPAARLSSIAGGEGSWTVNVTFDLRGTGESDGMPSTRGFEIDLTSIQAWASERFGPDVTFRPLGFPELGEADRLLTVPLRPGVMVELYRYSPPAESKASVLYFSRYANFARGDDSLCRELADDGYTVFGGDLMRYLLMAGPELTLDQLCEDASALAANLGRPLFVVARAFAAGPAMIMAAGTPTIDGVIVTGPAQEGLTPAHLFSDENPSHFVLSRQVKKLAPRPVIFLWNRAEAGKFDSDGLKNIYNQAGNPRLWAVVAHVDAPMLLNGLGWLGSNR